MDIYIKPAEKVQLVGKREVLLRDVAEVFLSGQTAGEAEPASWSFGFRRSEKRRISSLWWI